MNFLENIIINNITHISIVDYKKGEQTKMVHRPWYGIAFSLGGKLSYIHKSNKIHLEGNHVVFIPKNATYEVKCKEPGSFAVINFITTNDFDVNEFINTELQSLDTLQVEFRIMSKLFFSDLAVNKYDFFIFTYKIFSMLIKSYTKSQIPSPLNRSISYIDNNLSSPDLCNTQIAKSVCISEVYLRKLFSSNLSTTVNQYIQNKRIEKAKHLLTETQFSITEISEKCGYSCIYYFSRVFKRITGYTPTQYKQNNLYSKF